MENEYDLDLAREVILQAQAKLVAAQGYMSRGVAHENAQRRASRCLNSLHKLNEELLVQMKSIAEAGEEK